MRTVELFRSGGVEYNTLSVVNRLSEGRGAEIYRFHNLAAAALDRNLLEQLTHAINNITPQASG